MIVRCGVVKPDEPAVTCDVRADQRHHYHMAGTDRVWLNEVEDGFVTVQRSGSPEARDRGLAAVAARVPPERRVAAMPPPVEPDPPYQAHSPTSRAAAEALTDSGTKRRLVLALIAAGDGLTDEECQVALTMNPSTQRPRRVELVEMGLVRDSGRTRPTHSGREAVVWEAVR